MEDDLNFLSKWKTTAKPKLILLAKVSKICYIIISLNRLSFSQNVAKYTQSFPSDMPPRMFAPKAKSVGKTLKDKDMIV